MNGKYVFVRVHARTCMHVYTYIRTCALNFQAASRARPLACVRLRPLAWVRVRGFACVSGLLRVRECRKGRVHRANASRTQTRFLFKDVCVRLRGFACVSGLLRVRECRKGRVHRANASRTQTRFLFKDFQDVL